MYTLIIFFLSLSVLAHDGHGDHGGGTIQNGKLLGPDGITYLDAGINIEWAGQKFKRRVNDQNQIVYQFKGQTNSKVPTDKFLGIKTSGGELLKSFTFDHAGEWPESVTLTAPDMSDTVMLSKNKDLHFKWDSKNQASMVKIIIEVYSPSDLKPLGKLTISTNDDGEYTIPASIISKLPSGDSKIALKRIWLGSFDKPTSKSDLIGVRTVSSIVGRAKIID